jgi:hypothetical protein
MPLPALLTPIVDNSELRASERRTLKLLVDGPATTGLGKQALLHDVSAGGFLIESMEPLAIGDHLQVDLPEVGSVGGTVVWSSGGLFGCRFDQRLSKGAVSALLLRATPASETPQLLAQWEASWPPENEAEPALAAPLHIAEPARQKPAPGLRLAIILGASLGLWLLIFSSVGLI